MLVESWLAHTDPIPVIDEASVAVVRERVRQEGALLEFPEVALASIVNVASELGHNQRVHARGGYIAVRRILREGTAGIEVVAADGGSGIADPSEALKGTLRMAGTGGAGAPPSLGIGLAASIELADEVDFDVRIGEGTCVWARKFAKAVPRRRQVGIFGRPFPGEDASGDDCSFVRDDRDLLVGLADGLGHGPPAREASEAAARVLRTSSSSTIDRILEHCHHALQETRGVVMMVARLEEPGTLLQTGGVGNVSLQVYGVGPRWSATAPSLVLGARGQRLRVSSQDRVLAARDVVVLFTDGVSTRADLEGQFDLLREHPVVIAHQIVTRFARDNDDALAVVVA